MIGGKRYLQVSGIALGLTFALMGTHQASAAAYIVKDGEPMAEIVVTDQPCGSVQYAARELQKYIKKMTGAELPIFPPYAVDGEKADRLTEQYPAGVERMPVKIHLGDSFHADRFGITAEGLDWGGYRMKSGKDWMVLLGKDTDFTPIGIWGRHRGHWRNQGSKEWDKATGEKHPWGNPVGGKLWSKYNDRLGLWAYDRKGTLNAVYAFLRGLGIRWYMPGEIGEIVPEKTTIELPDVDKTVTPDCKIRKMSFARYALKRAEDELLWSLRVGANNPYGYHDYHGLAHVTRPERARKNHPEYYALYNGKRDIEAKTPNPCLFSDNLFEETVRYVRFVFDMYDVPAISVWPDDGFTKICQCDKCQGKATPERGGKGKLSDYVWQFVNRVATEVKKTHPDKLIIGGAYSTYWLPPQDIDKLSSNIAVHIVNGRRRYDTSEEKLEKRRDAVRKWAKLTDNKVIIFMNHGGAANTPNMFAEDIKAYNGLIMGEDMWGPYHGGRLAKPAFTHLNYYMAARLWWDMDKDADELLDEYYDRFYGPAADEMKAFINFYERNQRKLGPVKYADLLKKAIDLFSKAENAVSPETVYGKRVDQFAEGVERLKKRYDQVSMGRKNIPSRRSAAPSREFKEVKIDGKLTEKLWDHLHGRLKENQTGRPVFYRTIFSINAHGHNLYIGIKCYDLPGADLNITTTEDDDPAIWDGDYVDILLETPKNSYYQISVNPAGAVADLDRSKEGTTGFNWQSEADVVTHIDKEKGVWTIEARIPYTPSEQDPLHEVMGNTPANNLPWYFNICRQKKRGDHTARSAFSPTGLKTFHHVIKFGKLKRK